MIRSSSRWKRLLWLARWLALAPVLFCGAAWSAPIPFHHVELSYDLQGEALASFLQRFFGDQGMQVVLSQPVREQPGTLNGPRRGTAAQVFAGIAASNGLIGYYDGARVYVYKRGAVGTRSLSVPPEHVHDFDDGMKHLSIVDATDRYRVLDDSGVVVATGVPRFVDQAAALAAAVSHVDRSEGTEFRVFTLRYAWAADATFTVGNRRVTIPGVATLLRELLAPGLPDMGYAQDQLLRPSARRLGGTGLAAVGTLPPGGAGALNQPPDDYRTDGADDGSSTSRRLAVAGAAVVSASTSRIVADPYHNAILVRDIPERMPMYAELIKGLDVEMKMIELDASIIDVDTTRLRNLGVDWRVADNRAELLFGEAGGKQSLVGAAAADNVAQLSQIPGLQVGTIIGSGTQFLARLHALEQRNVAKVVTQPKVITLDDVEALIESVQELYVPVAGTYSEDLFNVTAGTVLRVTPHLINVEDRTRIRLLISIEDGAVQVTSQNSNHLVVQVPQVTRNAVTTQAVIDAGQSLLLGGLIRNTRRDSTDSVPLLNRLPLLGALFRNRSREHDDTARLFLISPRLVPSEAVAAGGAANGLPAIRVAPATPATGG
jgi:type III secretion protein C